MCHLCLFNFSLSLFSLAFPSYLACAHAGYRLAGSLFLSLPLLCALSAKLQSLDKGSARLAPASLSLSLSGAPRSSTVTALIVIKAGVIKSWKHKVNGIHSLISQVFKYNMWPGCVLCCPQRTGQGVITLLVVLPPAHTAVDVALLSSGVLYTVN